MVLQYTTQLLIPRAVQRILNIEYENYEVFGKTAQDDAIVRSSRQHEHLAYVQEQSDIVDATAKSWQLAPAMTAEDSNTLARVNQLLSNLLNAKPVHLVQLRKVLTATQLAAFKQSLRTPISAVEVLYADGVPDELKRYNVKLRDADFANNKFEKVSTLKRLRGTQSKHSTISNTRHQAEHLYELALEYLSEQLEAAEQNKTQDTLLRWLDRDVVFGEHNNVSIDVDGVPRVKGSRSHYATQDAALPKMLKRLKREQRLLEALLTAAVAIAYVPEVVDVSVQQSDAELIKSLSTKRKVFAAQMAELNGERD
jgi:hypothetical protein